MAKLEGKIALVTQFQDVGDVRLASRIPGMALIFQFPEEFAEAAARFPRRCRRDNPDHQQTDCKMTQRSTKQHRAKINKE